MVKLEIGPTYIEINCSYSGRRTTRLWFEAAHNSNKNKIWCQYSIFTYFGLNRAAIYYPLESDLPRYRIQYDRI